MDVSKLSEYYRKFIRCHRKTGLHNMADHRTIGRRKFFRLAEKIEDKTVRG